MDPQTKGQYDLLSGKPKPKTDLAPSKTEKKRASKADPKPTPEQGPSSEEILAAQAANLRDIFASAHIYLAISSSIAPSVGTEPCKVYRDKLLQEAGNPTDPIEVMLIEQIALAHFHIGRLHLKSCMAEYGPLVIAYADAATRLTAEFRRSALALEDYRMKQLARKGLAPSNNQPAMVLLVEEKGKPNRKRGKKKPVVEKVETNGQEIPECLRKRMSPTLRESGLVVSTN